MLDEVPEFRITVESLPAPKVTWIKDGAVLGNVAAEISTSLVKTGETRWAFHVPNSSECCGVIWVESTMSHLSSYQNFCVTCSVTRACWRWSGLDQKTAGTTPSKRKQATWLPATVSTFRLKVRRTSSPAGWRWYLFVYVRLHVLVFASALLPSVSWCISTSSIITLLRIFVNVFLGVNWRIFFWTLCSYMQAAFSRIGYCTKRVWSKIK